MKERRKIHQLFVASQVCEHEELVEPFVQYETFGQIDHHIIVSRKKYLIYSTMDDEGNIKYYDYATGEEVDESSFTSSFSTTSSAMDNLYCWGVSGYPIPIDGIRKKIIDRFKKQSRLVGYFIPFEEYFGLESKMTSPRLALALIKLSNITKRGYVKLSMDETKAKEQLQKIGCIRESSTKKL